MGEQKQRARRRADAHPIPQTDERFRVVVDEGEPASDRARAATPVASIRPGAREMVQPYVPAAGLEAGVGPATLPSRSDERAGAQPGSPVVSGAGSAGAPSQALPAKSPEERK